MTWILGIDTASTQLDLGLVNDGAAVCSYSRYSPGSHAEHIAQAVEFFLKTNDITPDTICCAGVTVGPGSFTGLRIGIAFVKGFFLTRATRALPVSSLEAIAMAWNGADGTFEVGMDARQDQVFCARFSKEGGTVTRLTDDSRKPLQSFLRSLDSVDFVLVDTLGYKKSRVPQAAADCTRAYTLDSHPLLRGLAAARKASELAGVGDEWLSPPELLPRYLQESAAETRKKVHGA